MRKRGGQRLAKSVGVEWRVFRTWLHDPSRIAEPVLKKLAEELEIPAHELVGQDWQTAFEQAQIVNSLRSDLAWPLAVIGWFHERAGAVGPAIGAYTSGVFALGSTASFTETWTLRENWSSKKFCVERLLDLAPPGLPAPAREYLDGPSRNKERAYWMNRAELAAKAGDHKDEYFSLYAAGWDVFSTNDASLLQRIADAAGRASSPALQAIAEAHLRVLR